MKQTFHHRPGAVLVLALATLLCPSRVPAQDAPPQATSTNQAARVSRRGTNDPIVRIREEGLERSHVMETLSYLTDVIGPRLTGSPNLKRANEWTREKLG